MCYCSISFLVIVWLVRKLGWKVFDFNYLFEFDLEKFWLQ
jgi:hypothetical protein